MIKYQITLKPLTPFFFGGENTFGEENINYFVRSNYLPQQTTLLGFLRYELLLQNNRLSNNPENDNWDSLIGPTSFQKTNGLFQSNFGAIKKISPVFLSNGAEHYITQSLDWGLATFHELQHNGCKIEKEKLFPLQYKLEQKGGIVTEKYLQKIPVLTAGGYPFKQKNGNISLWVRSDGQKMRQWDHDEEFEEGKGYENGLFIEERQVGIYRQTTRRREETGDFFKLVRYRLSDDFGFSFFVELEFTDNEKIESRIVTMGGERSMFQMIVTETNISFDQLFTKDSFTSNHLRKSKALVLTSDAYSEFPILEYCDFAITETTPFRNITSRQQQNGDYTRISGGAISKSKELLYLLKRGSIFYADDLTKLKDALLQPSFYTIGYNHFIEL